MLCVVGFVVVVFGVGFSVFVLVDGFGSCLEVVELVVEVIDILWEVFLFVVDVCGGIVGI